MKSATYTAFAAPCRVGAGAHLKGVKHPGAVVQDVVTSPVHSFDPVTGVIETRSTRYTKEVAPSKLYKPAHGGYPG